MSPYLIIPVGESDPSLAGGGCIVGRYTPDCYRGSHGRDDESDS